MADPDPERRRTIAQAGAAARWGHPDAQARKQALRIEKLHGVIDKMEALLADCSPETQAEIAPRIARCGAQIRAALAAQASS